MKKTPAFVPVCALALAVAACQRVDSPAAATVTATPAAEVVSTPAIARETRLRGTLVMGKDGYGLTPCGGQAQQIVSLSPAAQSFLEPLLQGGAREFFMDAWVLPATGTNLVISTIERAGGEGQGCETVADEAVFKLHGNEPFWSLTVAANRMVLERPDAQALEFAYDGIQAGSAAQHLHGDGHGGKIELKLERASCSDGMSDTLYAWKAELQFDGQAWQGCGYSGQR